MLFIVDDNDEDDAVVEDDDVTDVGAASLVEVRAG